MKNLVDKLTKRQKNEIKSHAIDLYVRGDFETTEECWIYAVLSAVKSLGLVEEK